MSEVFFTSDSHYSHVNCCRGVSTWKSGHRDFDTLEQMNDSIVSNINNHVCENDILYHLGDWSFGGIEQIKIFRERINCKNVHLILGNHDLHIARNAENTQKLFSSVAFYRELLLHKTKIILNHYAINEWNYKYHGSVHLYGHSHGNLKPSIKKEKVLELIEKGDLEHLKHLCINDSYNPKSMDVGVDTNNMKPYHIEDVLEKLSSRIEISDWKH